MVSIALIVWAWVLGPLGAILAIPLSTLARALLLDLDPSKRWLNGLLSSAVERPEVMRPRKTEQAREGEPPPGEKPERGPPDERRPDDRPPEKP
jgi:AI-2 transport protein TqsA